MNLRSYKTVKERRTALEKERNISLNHTGSFSIDEERASSRHCENMIGVTQVPLGVAGPLTVASMSVYYDDSFHTFNEGEYYLPLSTTEGALVASINRGCKAIRESGGAQTIVKLVGVSRGPVFEASSLSHAYECSLWIEQNVSQLDALAKETSSHISLLSISTQVIGKLVYVRFSYDTQEAMGMNMATIASQRIAEYLEIHHKLSCLSISGNYCVDKKSSALNLILGRGARAWSEVVLPTNVVTDVLKTSVKKLKQTYDAKCLIGSALSGSQGFNGHAANVIAAFYLATGQDIAHVVEGSQCVTTVIEEENGLRIAVYLPSVLVGTVGGGTALDTQKEALSLLGLHEKSGQSLEMAGIVASAVLAGEISELSALSSGLLTKAHEQLARGK